MTAEPVVSESLPELIARLEADHSPRDEYELMGPFRAMRHSVEQRSETPAVQLVAEEVAFTVYATDGEQPSAWGLYFGPMMSGVTPSGEPWEAPSQEQVTPDVLSYWRRRAIESSDLVMQGRYADLLWELPKKLEGVKQDVVMARVAVDAYLAAIEQRRYKHEVTAIARGKRALEIALSINDAERVLRARGALLALEEAVAEDDSLGLWGFCFDLFVEPPNRRVNLSDAQRDRLVADLEDRLARFAAGPPNKYHPAGPEAAALRLANHYRRLGRKADVARVLRVYGAIVRKMHGTAAALVATFSIEQLYNLFKSFELHQDADELNGLLRIAGQETLEDMKTITVTKEVPREKLEAYFAAMLSGTAAEVIRRIAVRFLPKRQEVEAQLRDLAKAAPITFMMARSLVDDQGRTIARVGPLESDLEGNVLQRISENLQLSIPWLRESVSRGLAGDIIPVGALVEFLLACPLFPAKRRGILEPGLEAYARRDAISAIHILVPQVEQAIRQLAVFVGAPVYTQRVGGGLHFKTLDALLRDEAVGEALGEDVVTYLRALLTDARGWNLRNTVCHGLAPVETFNLAVADRVVHALVVLALLREKTDKLNDSDNSA